MADNEIYEVATSFTDITALGQGYIDRVDGQQILLPLPSEVPQGEVVRYVVFLADGTPAFAGAGRCVRVSDGGDALHETLIDSLQFDERSQPVYEYLVAVRSATYGEAAATEAVRSEAPPQAQSVHPSDAPYDGADAGDADELGMEDEATVYTGPGAFQGAGAEGAEDADAAPVLDELADDQDSAQADEGAAFSPENIPRGILTRPALGVQWRTAHPQRPTGRPPGSNFQYEFGPLPAPAGPPRPDLDPSLWINHAPRPAADAPQARASARPDADSQLAEAFADSEPPESTPPASDAPDAYASDSLPAYEAEPETFADENENVDEDEAASEDTPASQAPQAVDGQTEDDEDDDANAEDEDASEVKNQEDPWV